MKGLNDEAVIRAVHTAINSKATVVYTMLWVIVNSL